MRTDRPYIELPRIIDIRSNAIQSIDETLLNLNLYRDGFMLASPTSFEVAGSQIQEILKDAILGLEYMDEATLKNSEKLIDIIKEKNVKYLLAIGGGTVIDIAKYASFKTNIPFLSIPTVASHDGIANSNASLKGVGKHSFKTHSPLGVIGDVKVISESPERYTISGCADIISNMTAGLDWEFSNRITGEHISQYALTLSKLIATTMIESKELIVKDKLLAAGIVLRGLVTSSIAMSIAGSSRPASGAEHMISHAIDELKTKKSLHGEQSGVASILTMYLHGGDWRTIKNTLEYINAPTRAEQLGITDQEMINAITRAHEIRTDRVTILGNGISSQAAEKALKATGIIDNTSNFDDSDFE